MPQGLNFTWEDLHSHSYSATAILCDHSTFSEVCPGAKQCRATSFLLSFAYSWIVRSSRQALYLWCAGAAQPGRALVMAAAALPGCAVSDDTNPTDRLYMKALISFTKISTGAIIAAVKCWQFLSMGHLLKCLIGVKNTWTNCQCLILGCFLSTSSLHVLCLTDMEGKWIFCWDSVRTYGLHYNSRSNRYKGAAVLSRALHTPSLQIIQHRERFPGYAVVPYDLCISDFFRQKKPKHGRRGKSYMSKAKLSFPQIQEFKKHYWVYWL